MPVGFRAKICWAKSLRGGGCSPQDGLYAVLLASDTLPTCHWNRPLAACISGSSAAASSASGLGAPKTASVCRNLMVSGQRSKLAAPADAAQQGLVRHPSSASQHCQVLARLASHTDAKVNAS